jgi:hypothetical protein
MSNGEQPRHGGEEVRLGSSSAPPARRCSCITASVDLSFTTLHLHQHNHIFTHFSNPHIAITNISRHTQTLRNHNTHHKPKWHLNNVRAPPKPAYYLTIIYLTITNLSTAARAHSQKDLPPSVETAYYRKCIDLRRRITDIEDSNDSTRQRILRLNRGVQKMRLERAFLLEQLNKHMEYNIDDSDRSSSPPPTPTDKPLRSKRSGGGHRKGSPEQVRGGGEQQIGMHGGVGLGMPMSSAHSTPDPSRISTSGAGTYFSPVNGGPPVLPPLHSLPPMRQADPTPTRTYYDPAADADHERQNGDTDMTGYVPTGP